MEFNFLKLVFTLTLEDDIDDPYLLFGIRTDFAEIFRRVTGCDRASCVKCLQAPDCSYQQIFSQAMHSDPSAIKRFQRPPLPFVFDPPLLPPVPNRGSRCEIGLTLVGLSVNHVVYFLDAVGFMFGQQESRWTEVANVVKIESVDYLCNRAIISQNGGKAALDQFFVLSMDGLEKSASLSTDEVHLTFATPLRIIKNGRPLRELSFSALAMSLIRRMSSIAFYYCFMELDLDYKWLSRQSQEIGISSNEFRWAEWDKGMSGIIGNGTFTGRMVEFHPFLLLGEYLHAGKGAAYGLGHYRLEKAG
ncbi:MAG TPA: CRISPR system precrRNA processing endoribonuclease RAMP protein Cas6 [Geobacteraceae bacterium]|nr:CRISPR system precrRNA processing endoribonuclease RAMP protein Cas6 [Geobacteraceae bacterium]